MWLGSADKRTSQPFPVGYRKRGRTTGFAKPSPGIVHRVWQCVCLQKSFIKRCAAVAPSLRRLTFGRRLATAPAARASTLAAEAKRSPDTDAAALAAAAAGKQSFAEHGSDDADGGGGGGGSVGSGGGGGGKGRGKRRKRENKSLQERLNDMRC